MKKNLLKAFMFAVLGVFSMNTFAQESDIEDAIVAVVSDKWIPQDGTTYKGDVKGVPTFVCGDPSGKDITYVTSPEFNLITPSITVRYSIEAQTDDWKNDVVTECRFNYVNTSGEPAESREVFRDYNHKDDKIIIEKTFEVPADWQEGTEVRTTVSVGAKAGNIVTKENLSVTAPVLYISEMSTENTEKIEWNEGKKIRIILHSLKELAILISSRWVMTKLIILSSMVW